LLARSPDVILEIRAAGLTDTAAADDGRSAWSTLPSIAAVRNGRIHVLTGDYLVVPGPRLAAAVEAFAAALHPDVFRGSNQRGNVRE
jgi:iron complex transport system substrate-binding protein